MRRCQKASRSTFATTAALVLAVPAAGSRGPTPVSPGATSEATLVEDRCPTFQWAGIPEASGYEIAVFRVGGDEGGPQLVGRASLPAGARGWTPAANDCLERGGRYAWSVAAAGQEPAWSAPFLFEVDVGPSLDEVERALDTLRRYRARRPREPDGSERAAGTRDELRTVHAREKKLQSRAVPGSEEKALARRAVALDRGALTAPTTGPPSVASGFGQPSLGTPSLRVDSNIALGYEANLFKQNFRGEDEPWIWDDAYENLALGRSALGSSDERHEPYTMGQVQMNVAVGEGALGSLIPHYDDSYFSTGNTAVGWAALESNVYGSFNTAVGHMAARDADAGDYNTAVGANAMHAGGGYRNTAVGYGAATASGMGNSAFGAQAAAKGSARNTAIGYQTSTGSGSDNISLGSGAKGTSEEGNTIRIGGTAVGTGEGQQNRTFINGIRGVETENGERLAVVIDENGQLGTESSSRRYKQDIHALGHFVERLLELRPVAFRYRQDVRANPDAPLQFGLIAEEVADVFPELVVFDDGGKPEAVRYRLLSTLLLGEVQRLHERLEDVEKRLHRRGGRSRSP